MGAVYGSYMYTAKQSCFPSSVDISAVHLPLTG